MQSRGNMVRREDDMWIGWRQRRAGGDGRRLDFFVVVDDDDGSILGGRHPNLVGHLGMCVLGSNLGSLLPTY